MKWTLFRSDGSGGSSEGGVCTAAPSRPRLWAPAVQFLGRSDPCPPTTFEALARPPKLDHLFDQKEDRLVEMVIETGPVLRSSFGDRKTGPCWISGTSLSRSVWHGIGCGICCTDTPDEANRSSV